ncbi:hypothetical protein GGR53DRAFT_528960 [Hypoxylon sp. FL1150]|nr:hypothetical protein GGR53DRAFT_528960 [Hypoxylon sp. FL1150]
MVDWITQSNWSLPRGPLLWDVRKDIYRLMIPQGANLIIDRKAWKKLGYSKHRPCVTKDGDDCDYVPAIVALSLTCKMFHTEISQILYSQNTIVTHHPTPLRHLTWEPQGVINSLDIRLVSGPRPSPHRIKKWLPVLSRIGLPFNVHLCIVFDYELRNVRQLEQVAMTKTLLDSVYQRPLLPRTLKLKLENRRLLRFDQGSTQQETGQVEFQWNALPHEIRRDILKYTDLVTPYKKIHWSQSGYSLDMGDNGARRYKCYWSSRDRRHTIEGYYHPIEQQFPYWEKPTALFLVSRAFSSEAKTTFLADNQFTIEPSSAYQSNSQGSSWASEVVKILSQVPSPQLHALRELEIKDPFVFQGTQGDIQRNALWADYINVQLHNKSIGMELLSFAVELRDLPENVAALIRPGIPDTLCHVSKIVDRFFWPLDTVGRRPGVLVLAIKIDIPGLYHGYYYLRRGSADLPEALQGLHVATDDDLVRLVNFTPYDGAEEVKDALIVKKGKRITVRSSISVDKKIYKDAFVEGLRLVRY